MVEEEAKQPSRCILVLGTGRSGTSAVGGVLYHLGVWMGDSFVGRDKTNPWGTFEDAELFFLTRQMRSGIAKPEQYGPQIVRRNQRPLWGWKDPGLVWTLQHALPYFEDVRAVFMHRDRGPCVLSAKKAYNWNDAKAKAWYDSTRDQLLSCMELLEQRDTPILHLGWLNLLNETKAHLADLAEFAYDGLEEQPTPEQMAAAERHLKRG